MAKKSVKFCVVDAFTDSAFKGNPAAVCLLEDVRDEEWMQSVAREFNLSETCFLTRLPQPAESTLVSVPRFRLRWFTPVAEVKLCGHATLAASHFLFTYTMVESNMIEFSTLSGILTAKSVSDNKLSESSNSPSGFAPDSFVVELDFPVGEIMEYDGPVEVSTISKSLNGASVSEISGGQLERIFLAYTGYDIWQVVLPSGEGVVEAEPNFHEMLKIPGRGIIITGPATMGSGFDFFSRFFCPKLGIDEDPVCGSAHCALAAYWSRKLVKCDLTAFQASRRSGVLNLHIDETSHRVLLRGKAVVVMEGSLLV